VPGALPDEQASTKRWLREFIAMLRNPQPSAGKIWAGFTAANLLSFFGGTAMTLEERLVPAAFTVLCGLMMAACWRPSKKTDVTH
jgi:hypothetical protein